MKKILLAFALLVSIVSAAQNKTVQSQYGFSWVNRGEFKGALRIPITNAMSTRNIADATFDTAQIYYDITDSTIKWWTGTQWLGPNSGTGTVTNVATGFGLSGGPITTTGTILVDSATLSTYYLRRKDSTTNYATQFDVLYKVNTTDTASMLANYLRGATEGWGINISGTQHKTWEVDSSQVATQHDLTLVGGSQTLQEVFDIETGEALLDKNDTINIAGNTFHIRSASNGNTVTTIVSGNVTVTSQVTGSSTVQQAVNSANTFQSNATLTTGGYTVFSQITNAGQYSELNINPDSIIIKPNAGKINIDSLRMANSDTAGYKPMVWNIHNKSVRYFNSWAEIGLGSGSGPDSLADLVDVNILSPLENQIIRYDETTDKWVNDTAAIINEFGLQDESLIKYDESAGEYVPIKSDSLFQSLEFTVGDSGFPDNGATDIVLPAIKGRIVKVHVQGLLLKEGFQYTRTDDSTLTFANALETGNPVYIETTSQFIHSTIDTTGMFGSGGGGGGGDWQDLTFTTNTLITNTSQVFTPTSGAGFGHTGLDNLKLASGNDGFIVLQFASSDGINSILGFNTTNSEAGFSAFEAGLDIGGDNQIYRVDGPSGTATATGLFVSTGDWVGLNRTGSTVKLITKSGSLSTTLADWTVAYTFSFSSSADLFIVCDLYTVGAAKMYYPQGHNIE